MISGLFSYVEMGTLRRDRRDSQNICESWDVEAGRLFVVDVFLHFLKIG
jgi:hypothetical protein